MGITERESSKSCNHLLDGKSLVSKYSKTKYHCVMHLKTQHLSTCPTSTACHPATVRADFTVFIKALRHDLCQDTLSWEQRLAHDRCLSGNRGGVAGWEQAGSHAGCSATCTEKPMQDLGRISLLFLREFHKLGKNVFLKWNKHQIIHIWQNAILTRQSDQ